MKEEWKAIVDIDGYDISNFGSVRSYYYGKKITNTAVKTIKTRNCRGYRYFNVYKNGKLLTLSVHRQVALAFIDNPQNKPCVNHKDYDRANNKASNLEWVTHAENNKHRELNNRVNFSKGSNHYKAKLTEEEVLSIKADIPFMAPCDIARKYGIEPYMIQNIKRGITWKWLN